MGLMENTAPWESHSPWEREESNRHLRQLPESTALLQDLTVFATSTSAPSAPSAPATPFSSVLGEVELKFGEAKAQPGRTARAAKLPVEILCIIFEILAARREATELKNCGSTCKRWANVALPLLYCNCGFGIFQYIPPQPYRKQNSYAAVPYSDSPFYKGRPLVTNRKLVLRQACYWRTLLSSCFWKDELGPGNATLYPYLQYVENLDLLVMAIVVYRYHAPRYPNIRNALFGVGTNCEGFMAQHFGNIQDGAFRILSRMLDVLLPRIKHLKSVNVFTEDDVTGNHTWPDKKIFARTIVQPMLENMCKFSRLANLEISGQENLTPAFGRVIKAIRPSLIGPDNKTINKTHTFSLRITGAQRIWTGVPDLTEESHRNKAFLNILNENSVTMVDFDIADSWGWGLDHISEFLIRQARTLKAIRLRGIGGTFNTWQLLDRMGRRGCRVRGLDLENRHVHHPPVIFDPSAWAFNSGLLKKLKYISVEGFGGITNSVTNYHMIDPTAFSIVLKHNLFGGKRTGNRLTPPIKTLVLNRTIWGSKVPEQIGAFAMHLAPTLTTLEIGYLSNRAITDDFTPIANCREQGRYKLIEVLMKLTQLKRLKAVGYAAEILLCSCIIPSAEGNQAPDADMSRSRSLPRPSTPVGRNVGTDTAGQSPPRPSTPVGYNSSVDIADTGSLNVDSHPALTPYHVVNGIMLPSSHRPELRALNPPALRLFTDTWKSSLEELELMASGRNIFTVHGGLVDDTLWLFTQLQKLQVFTLLFSDANSRAAYREYGLNMPQPLQHMYLNRAHLTDDDDGEWTFRPEGETGDLPQVHTPGKFTPDGLLRFINALPRMAVLCERFVMKKLWIGKTFMDPNRSENGVSGVAKKEKWPQWAVHIAETMNERGAEFVLA